MNFRLLHLGILALLTACGGGGGSSDPASGSAQAAAESTQTAGSPAGLYRGTTSTGRSIAGIVLENGEFWLLYSVAGNSSLIAGADQGHGTFANGAFTSNDLRDFNLEGLGISDGSAVGTYKPKTSIDGGVAFRSSMVNFSATYDAAFDGPSSQAAAAGNYSGTAAVLGGTEPATLALSVEGALSGVSQHGCRFSGTSTARATGNVFILRVTFAGGVCSNGTSTVNGVAYYDAATGRVYAAALNSGRSNGFIFAGGK